MKTLTLWGLLIFISLGLSGQNPNQTQAPNASRWQMAFHTGIDLRGYDSYASDEDKGSTFYQFAAHYRLSRMVDIGLHFGYQRNTFGGYSEYTSDQEPRPILTYWQGRQQNRFLGIQPRFNYRLGQGDLSAFASLGLLHHRNVLELTSPHPWSSRLGFTSLVDYYYSIGAGYTYWPTSKIGFVVEITHYRFEHGRLSGPTETELGSTYYVIERANLPNWSGVGNVVPDNEAFEAFRQSVSQLSRVYLTVGIKIRPF